MATKLIDFIQSEQIVKLEEDVNILKNTLNLLIGDINILAPKLATIISNLNTVASAIGNNYDPTNLTRHRTWRNGTAFHSGAISTDGVLKRLTDFDTYYTSHISKKFPPVVDITGKVHVGYHTEHNTTSPAMEHAHPEGWQGQTGTCLAATVVKNPNYPGGVFTNGITNVSFQTLASTLYVPTNITYAGQREWDTFPRAHIITDSSGNVTSSDFRMDQFGGQSKNGSYGHGWSVGDQMMSMFGATYSGVWRAAWFATVSSVGSQLQAKPYDNTPGGTGAGSALRTPHGYLNNTGNNYNINDYGDPSPGVGGPTEPADWGEGGSHNIMDPSNQLDDQGYITTVLNTGVVPSYLNQEQILFMSDEDKAKRATKLIRMTKNRLHDDGIWQTEDVDDGVLTAEDL